MHLAPKICKGITGLKKNPAFTFFFAKIAPKFAFFGSKSLKKSLNIHVICALQNMWIFWAKNGHFCIFLKLQIIEYLTFEIFRKTFFSLFYTKLEKTLKLTPKKRWKMTTQSYPAKIVKSCHRVWGQKA